MSLENDDFIKALTRACEGLLFQSESDYELKPFIWKATALCALNAPTVLKFSGLDGSAIVETEDIEDFFRVALRDQDWHGPKEKEDVRRFRYLVKLLKENLKDLIVFRVGSREIDVYV